MKKVKPPTKVVPGHSAPSHSAPGHSAPGNPVPVADRVPRGRPPHPVPLKQHPVSMPADLWQWATRQPAGASALVRTLLERERRWQAAPFSGISVEDAWPIAVIETPFGSLTVIEVAGRGAVLLRDDGRHHFLRYLGDKTGWSCTFGEDDLHEIVPPGAEVHLSPEDYSELDLPAGTGDNSTIQDFPTISNIPTIDDFPPIDDLPTIDDFPTTDNMPSVEG